MSKTLRKILIYFLAASFVFAGFWQIFPLEKAAAQSPPGPSDYILEIKSTDTLYGTVRIKATTGGGSQPREFMFTLRGVLNVRNFASGSDIPSYNGRKANDNDVIKLYTLTNPSNLYCQSGSHREDIYMISVLYDGMDDLYHFAGIYTASTTLPAGGEQNRVYSRIQSGSFGWGGVCNNIHNSDPTAEAIIKQANSDNYRNAVVLLTISDEDRITRCNSLERRWEEFKTKVRQLMEPVGPIALQAPTTVTTQNPYWSQSIYTDIKWVDLGVEIGHIFTNENSVFDNTYNLTIDLNLTTEGKALVEEIADLVAMMKTDFTILKQAYPGSTWPDGCVKLKVFKWDSNFPNPPYYSSLDQFSENLNKMYTVFQEFMESQDEPIGPHEDACGGFPVSIGLKTVSWMFCELGLVLHAAAVYFLKKSLGWLTAIIGINVNMKFTQPRIKKDTTTGGTSD